MDASTGFAIGPGMGLLMADLGIRPDDVLRRAGLPRDLFSRKGVYLSPDDYFRLWDALEAETGDPNLAVRIGKVISVEVFDPPIFAAFCSAHLNMAAERLAVYKKLVGPMSLRVVVSDTETTLEHVWPVSITPPPGFRLTELVFWVSLARLATRHHIRPSRAQSPQLPAHTAELNEYLEVEVTEGPSQSVTFSAEDAKRPFLTANEKMWEFFEPGLQKRLSELQVGSSITERVRGALLEMLPAGRASMDAVARELGMSTRTLQRRLTGEGSSFKDALNRTREALARHYLRTSAMSAAEISFLLGYEDPNSFYRAFRNWTGQTPQAVRASA